MDLHGRSWATRASQPTESRRLQPFIEGRLRQRGIELAIRPRLRTVPLSPPRVRITPDETLFSVSPNELRKYGPGSSASAVGDAGKHLDKRIDLISTATSLFDLPYTQSRDQQEQQHYTEHSYQGRQATGVQVAESTQTWQSQQQAHGNSAASRRYDYQKYTQPQVRLPQHHHPTQQQQHQPQEYRTQQPSQDSVWQHGNYGETGPQATPWAQSLASPQPVHTGQAVQYPAASLGQPDYQQSWAESYHAQVYRQGYQAGYQAGFTAAQAGQSFGAHEREFDRRPTSAKPAHLLGHATSDMSLTSSSPPSYRHYTTSRGHSPGSSSPSRRSPYTPLKPLPLRPGPRDSYLESANSEPQPYPPSLLRPPRPLPLLLLDLNGTLVFRGGSSFASSSNPTRRPYLNVFLIWALGLPVTNVSREERLRLWEEWDTQRDGDQEEEGAEGLGEAVDDFSLTSKWPVGTRFWKRSASPLSQEGYDSDSPFTDSIWRSHSEEPVGSSRARVRLFLWSSAQPQNVVAMTRAIFTPGQAAELLRVWARDTLVPKIFRAKKAASTKDLEVVWAALNVDRAGKKGELRRQHEGERRVQADRRFEMDGQDVDTGTEENHEGQEMHNTPQSLSSSHSRDAKDPQAALEAALGAHAFVKVPKPRLNVQTGQDEWVPGRGYGSHNTLLLDDSPDKARLQPFNHLLIPEFDAVRAKKARKWRMAKQSGKSTGDDAMIGPVEDEDILDMSRATSNSVDSEAATRSTVEDDEQPSADQKRALLAGLITPPLTSELGTTSSSDRESNPHPELRPDEDLDDVLLQLIGVLAHVRWQRNVSAWIRSGALGAFGGMKQPGTTDELVSKIQSVESQHQTHRDDSSLSSGALKTEAEEHEAKDLRLHHEYALRTEQFWTEEGRAALRAAGIPCTVD
ncbi:hypothetical protein CBOM_00070 [Ceraceosorus bombacis]|uniref:FCP1 homology domain-containing protein n=1 Tax=Ceraceosorus bombacis TaxID=401625 RepID=A0A0P1B825_9BASI|nr:hypothetical protein CBOM_00070 [Ceraceosorus bombacis]